MLKLKLYFSTLGTVSGKGKLFEKEDPPETISPSISDILNFSQSRKQHSWRVWSELMYLSIF